MSMITKEACERALLIINQQKQIDNREIDEYEIAAFIYSSRDKILARLLKYGSTDRNYGNGTVAPLVTDGYTMKQMDVEPATSSTYYGFTLPNDYLDVRENAGVVMIPLGRADRNPYVQIAYGTQWNSQLINMEGNIPYWVEPHNMRVCFISDPGTKVGVLVVETVSADNIDMDAEIKMPPHIHDEVIRDAASMFVQKRTPDTNNNAVDQQPRN